MEGTEMKINMETEKQSEDLQGVAIIGMSGRFPGANSTQQFWNNLREGKESIIFFEANEEQKSGSGIIEGADEFDANFFDFTPREAEYTDPQHRLFLECAHEVFETAGYGKFGQDERIGVYAGSGQSGYLLHVLSQQNLVDSIGEFQLLLGNQPDFLPSRVSYKFNLNGPSMAIQTACSSSLVSVHTAVQALLTYECDMALAGGVSVRADQTKGLKYQEGGVLSKEGHCRAFDADASGMVHGNGAGVVLLKRLSDAVEEGDQILAVIKGTAVNNDGSQKIGYTAPSVSRQADVIREALSVANVSPKTISYVEAHGTGTPLGDSVEVAALTEAFGSSSKAFCALGSVKTNIGHLDSAAGVAGLIKAVLSLQNKKISPTLHFKKPNPKMELENSPFYVNTQNQEWNTDGIPRRAGVSSFGMGGTNAHVILEEYEDKVDTTSISDDTRGELLSLSAKSPTALKTMTQNMIYYLEKNRPTNLSDIAYTLTVGRNEFQYRITAVGYDWESAAKALREKVKKWTAHEVHPNSSLPPVFLFFGKDYLEINKIKGLYQSQPVFKTVVDNCSEYLKSLLSLDLREILFPSEEKKDETPLKSIYADPILFTIQYALALQWKEWGVKYEKMIGEGIGEYVAACLSEVMKVEDALKLILERARFLQENHSESDARNTNDKLERFKEVLAEVRLQKPRIGYISSLSGEWITNEQAVDPLYWVSHLSESPRTKEGIEELLNSGYNSFLEIGHEEFLDWIINLNRKEWKAIRRFNALPEDGFSFEEVLTTVGKLWSSGVVVDRMSLFKGKKFKRVALPTYPFEKKKYFIEMNAFPDQLAYMQNSNEVEIQPEKVTASVPLQKAEVEEKTKEIWEELLGIEGIKINQDFFDLGGDSLLGVQLVTRLREVFNLNVSIDIVFEFPTIAKMAEEIAGELMEEDDLAEVEQLLREIEVMTDKQK